MPIGPDIKEVFEELGTAITLIKPDGTTVEGEYMDYDDPFHDASTELQRQFALTVSFSYDSQVIIGDIIGFVNHSEYYIVIGVKPSYFEDESVTKEAYLLRCNVNGSINRKVEVRDMTDYETSVTWPALFEEIRGVQFERGTNTEAEEFSNVMEVPVGTQILYISGYDIKEGDRWYPDFEDTTEYYRIDTVHKRRFSNGTDACFLCFLADDTRE